MKIPNLDTSTPFLTTQQRREICAAAAKIDRTVCRAYNGISVAPESWNDIVAAARKLGHPLPRGGKPIPSYLLQKLDCGLTVWLRQQLVAESGLGQQTVSKAYRGQPVTERTARLLTAAAAKLGLPRPDFVLRA